MIAKQYDVDPTHMQRTFDKYYPEFMHEVSTLQAMASSGCVPKVLGIVVDKATDTLQMVLEWLHTTTPLYEVLTNGTAVPLSIAQRLIEAHRFAAVHHIRRVRHFLTNVLIDADADRVYLIDWDTQLSFEESFSENNVRSNFFPDTNWSDERFALYFAVVAACALVTRKFPPRKYTNCRCQSSFQRWLDHSALTPHAVELFTLLMEDQPSSETWDCAHAVFVSLASEPDPHTCSAKPETMDLAFDDQLRLRQQHPWSHTRSLSFPPLHGWQQLSPPPSPYWQQRLAPEPSLVNLPWAAQPQPQPQLQELYTHASDATTLERAYTIEDEDEDEDEELQQLKRFKKFIELLNC